MVKRGKSVLTLITIAYIGMILCYSNTISAAIINHSTQHKIIQLTIHKGKLIYLPQEPKTVFLADPSIADLQIREPGVIYLFAKKIGETSLYVRDQQNRTIINYTIRVQADIKRLQKMLINMFGIRDIHIEMLNDKILVKGNVDSAKNAEEAKRLAANFAGGDDKVINFMHVNSASQINLRVQVVEMSRDISRAIGVNWSAFYNTKNISAGLNAGSLISSTSFGGLVAAGNLLGGGNLSINALVDLLESEGLVSVLSQPSLTALSGETASFLAGGEFPIPIAQALGAISIDYKKFGVSLSFTPTLVSDNLINLKVNPEVSEISDQTDIKFNNYRYNVPAIVTRRAQTTVELRSGQSFVIAGLLQNNTRKYVNKVPGLAQIPILGNLFRSEQFKRGETELVIIVTPYIVKPTVKKNIALPIPQSRKKHGFMMQ